MRSRSRILPSTLVSQWLVNPSPSVMIGQFKGTGNSAGFTVNRAYQALNLTTSDIYVNRIGVSIATQAGNIDLGLYAADGTGAPNGVASTLLISTGSTVCPAAGYYEAVIPVTKLLKGYFWIACATDSASTGFTYIATSLMLNPGTGTSGTVQGNYYSDTSFPLPNPLVAPATTTNMPCLWVRYV